VLFQQKESLDIRHVAGSSGGSVAATVVTQLREVPATLPHHHHHQDQDQQHDFIDEYARALIKQRGRALTLLKERLTENVNSRQQQHSSQKQRQQQEALVSPVLGICTTKCSDGTAHMFHFPSPIQDDKQLELLLTCVEASCAIPRSFHPWDIFTSSLIQYPDEEGIRIRLDDDDNNDNDDSYVDGGIAAPAPPTPPELTRIIISPVAGESPYPCHRISPVTANFPSSLRLLPLRVGDFGVQTSLQNLKALRASAGMVSTQELQEWYEQGQRDAERFVHKFLPGLE
jgi:predicted acylesterase/phospholipase RssA